VYTTNLFFSEICFHRRMGELTDYGQTIHALSSFDLLQGIFFFSICDSNRRKYSCVFSFVYCCFEFFYVSSSNGSITSIDSNVTTINVIDIIVILHY
jgi:hypothetical protein